MRSAASHFSTVIRFVVFAVVVVALSFAVIRFAQNSSKGPQSSQPASDEANQPVESNKKAGTTKTSGQGNSSSDARSEEVHKKNSTRSGEESSSNNSSTSSQTVPNTGLDLFGTLVGLTGVMTATYFSVVYWRSRSQLFEA